MSAFASGEPFKSCTLCGRTWASRNAFLSDPMLVVKGYQADFESLENGLFIFLHARKNCETGLAMDVRSFMDLYNGPAFSERMTGTDVCPGYCLNEDEMRPCVNACECAPIRSILQIVREWPKENSK